MATVIGQFFKNIMATYAVMVTGLLIAFFFTPYLIDMLGKERYGLWTLVFSIVAYMGLADLGMKQSIVRFVSKHYATKDWKQLNEVISSSARIYFFVSVIIVAATMTIAFGFVGYFKIPQEFMKTARMVVIVLGFSEAVRYIYLPFTSLGAFHRFDISGYFQLGTRVIQTLGIIVILEAGLGLVEMAVLILGLTLVTRIWMSAIRVRKFPEVHFSRKAINAEKTRELLNYGIYSFLIVATWIVIFQTDNIIIGALLSMEAVAVYSIAGMIVTQIRSSIQVIAIPLVPAISHFEAEKDFARIMNIYSRAVRYLYYISAYLAICILTYGGPFIILWIEKDFTDAISVLHVLIISSAVFFPQTLANSVLFGVSKHKVAFYVLITEAVTKVALSLVLVPYWGIMGAAWGTAIPQLIIYIFVYPIVFYRVMNFPVKTFYLTSIKSIAASVVFVLPPAYLMSIILKPDSWLKLIVDCSIVTVLMLTGFSLYILEPDDRKRLIGKLFGRFMGDYRPEPGDAKEELRD